MAQNILEAARHRAGLTQLELSTRASTSRPTLSAYESGRKSPTLDTAERILRVAGFVLSIDHIPKFRKVRSKHGRPFYVAEALWRLPLEDSFAKVQLPLSVNWSDPGRTFDLAKRKQRNRCYEIVLREGMPADIAKYVDGALLLDAWEELVLPRDLRREWSPIITTVSE